MSRTIVLTGATRGLGRALVDEFVRRGHTVLGCGRSPAGCETLARTYGAPHAFAPVNVSDRAAVHAWADRIAAAGHSPDLLVNNAALMNLPAPLWKVPPAEFDRLLAVNVGGIFNVLHTFLPGMLHAGRGTIINLSIGWGRSTSPDVAPYCASKYAVEGLTGSLAAELPEPLAAVALNPGVIDTDMLRTAWSDGAAGYPKPADWAPAAAELILGVDRSRNGEQLTVPAP